MEVRLTMMKTSLTLFAILFVKAALSTPAISKYDLNADFVDATLSRLQPEKEIIPTHVEYMRNLPIQVREAHFEPESEYKSEHESEQESEAESEAESEPTEPMFDDEANDEDNEIDDSVEDDGELFADAGTDETDAAAAQAPEDTPKDTPKDTPEMRAVIHSFLAIVPNNTLLSQLFRKAAGFIILKASNSTSPTANANHT